jgi:CTP:molybdopterin cytidylyltransferase MocA
MIPILILAAGESRRMRGRDKLAEPVGGVPLLRRQTLAALTLGEPVFVALPGPGHDRMLHIADLDVTPLIVPEASEGMGGTLRGAVAQLPFCDAFLVVLADLPLIGAEEMRRVMNLREATSEALIWRGTTEDGKPGHPILFDAELRPEFNTISGDTGGELIVRSHPVAEIRLPGDAARLDLDTPEDWDVFRAQTGL